VHPGTRSADQVLVLWDVDHTLIDNGGVSKQVYARAFELLTGGAAASPARTDGRTDPLIMANMLADNGLPESDAYLTSIPEALAAAMAEKESSLRRLGHALPGARAALQALRDTPGVIQTVLSGNIRPNALAKLAAFGLDAYLDFEVGGYGSDDAVRSHLVGVARDRARARYGVALDASDTVLIGDTPRDVRAGRDGGAYVIGVATGHDSMDHLLAEGADAVLPDLSNTSALVSTVTCRPARQT
jgi:phosphoglycolate phosphatase-like HAD superfamily hydrolase